MFIYKESNPIREVDFFCLSKNSKVAALAVPETLTADTEGEKIGLPEENIAQVSSKHNDYQVEFV